MIQKTCFAWLGLAALMGCSPDAQQASSAASAGAASQAPSHDDKDKTTAGAAAPAMDSSKPKAENQVANPGSSSGQATAKAGTGGAAPSASQTAGTSAAPMDGAAGSAASSTEHFSFFVTSFAALQRLAKSPDGFGGDLRYGEPDGLAGADKICREIAESSMPGAGSKTWRAFLSVTKGPDGMPVHAIDRIGNGPWYDRLGAYWA